MDELTEFNTNNFVVNIGESQATDSTHLYVDVNGLRVYATSTLKLLDIKSEGNSEFNGVFLFSQSPIVPNATNNNHAVNYGQVTSYVGNLLNQFTLQTAYDHKTSGTNGFSGNVPVLMSVRNASVYLTNGNAKLALEDPISHNVTSGVSCVGDTLNLIGKVVVPTANADNQAVNLEQVRYEVGASTEAMLLTDNEWLGRNVFRQAITVEGEERDSVLSDVNLTFNVSPNTATVYSATGINVGNVVLSFPYGSGVLTTQDYVDFGIAEEITRATTEESRLDDKIDNVVLDVDNKLSHCIKDNITTVQSIRSDFSILNQRDAAPLYFFGQNDAAFFIRNTRFNGIYVGTDDDTLPLSIQPDKISTGRDFGADLPQGDNNIFTFGLDSSGVWAERVTSDSAAKTGVKLNPGIVRRVEGVAEVYENASVSIENNANIFKVFFPLSNGTFALVEDTNTGIFDPSSDLPASQASIDARITNRIIGGAAYRGVFDVTPPEVTDFSSLYYPAERGYYYIVSGSKTISGLNLESGDLIVFENAVASFADLVVSRDIQQVEASDATVVRTYGNQTIDGVKAFTSSVVIPTPTTDMQATTKKYVDDGLAEKPDLATTLAGYGIVDAYTKVEVDTEISGEILAHNTSDNAHADIRALIDNCVVKTGAINQDISGSLSFTVNYYNPINETSTTFSNVLDGREMQFKSETSGNVITNLVNAYGFIYGNGSLSNSFEFPNRETNGETYTLATEDYVDNLIAPLEVLNPALTVTDNVATWVVTHNLNFKYVQVNIWEEGVTPRLVYASVVATDANTITISIDSATDIVADTYKAVIRR